MFQSEHRDPSENISFIGFGQGWCFPYSSRRMWVVVDPGLQSLISQNTPRHLDSHSRQLFNNLWSPLACLSSSPYQLSRALTVAIAWSSMQEPESWTQLDESERDGLSPWGSQHGLADGDFQNLIFGIEIVMSWWRCCTSVRWLL